MNDVDAPLDSSGTRLREMREYLGFSVEEVARHLGLPETEMSLMEGGARRTHPRTRPPRPRQAHGTSVEFLTGTDRAMPGWGSFPDLDETAADISAADRNEILRFAQFLSSACEVSNK